MYGLENRGRYWRRKNNVEKEKKTQLEGVFKAYASDKKLTQKQLKEAFYHLGSLMPYKEAEEAMKAANIDTDKVVSCDSNEFNYLVEYAYNKGYGDSI